MPTFQPRKSAAKISTSNISAIYLWIFKIFDVLKRSCYVLCNARNYIPIRQQQPLPWINFRKLPVNFRFFYENLEMPVPTSKCGSHVTWHMCPGTAFRHANVGTCGPTYHKKHRVTQWISNVISAFIQAMLRK